MLDMAGLDVGMRMREDRIRRGVTKADDPAHNPLLERLGEMGRYGQKTGAGIYAYDGRKPSPDPVTEDLLSRISEEKGILRRPVSDEEIVERVLFSAVNEGAKILEEGIAQRASDIDVVYVFGYGFPKYRGGPMFWAEQQGLGKVHGRIEEYHDRFGDRWKPAGLLTERAAAGKGWKG
jgi:3-hydroxyacyl-CoA dehydrogenase